MTDDPHSRAEIARAGPSPEDAARVVLLLHGRGGSARDMLGLAEHLSLADTAWIAPEAAGRSWWPDSFLAPFSRNEPHLTSALALVARVADGLPGPLSVIGFSQGACLAAEAVARGLVAAERAAILSGALVGTGEPGGAGIEALYGHAPKSFDYAPLRGAPRLHFSCHESDPHIPLARVRESDAAFEALGAAVATTIHPGAGHGILEADVAMARALLG